LVVFPRHKIIDLKPKNIAQALGRSISRL
jgi:hypothetical protein